MPVFPVALVWSRPDHAASAGRMLTALEAHRSRLHLKLIEFVPRENGATVYLEFDLPMYPQQQLEPLRVTVQQGGGRLLEPWLLPECDRPAACAILRDGDGKQPKECADLTVAAKAVKGHLSSLKKAPAAPAPAARKSTDPAPVISDLAGAADAPAPVIVPPPPGAEKRKAPRYDVILSVQFKTDEDLTREYATNLSKGGLYLTASQCPQCGSLASLAVLLPDGQVLNVAARVKHVSEVAGGFGVGLEFVEEEGSSFHEALDAYLSSRKPDEGNAG